MPLACLLRARAGAAATPLAAGSSSVVDGGGGAGGRGEEHPCALEGCQGMCKRKAQVYCIEGCYEKSCLASGVEAQRCPRGADCAAANGPGIQLSGCAWGAACCRWCYNSDRAAKERTAAAGLGGGAGGGAVKKQRAAPAKQAVSLMLLQMVGWLVGSEAIQKRAWSGVWVGVCIVTCIK